MENEKLDYKSRLTTKTSFFDIRYIEKIRLDSENKNAHAEFLNYILTS